MDNADLEVLQNALAWQRAGHRTILATVVGTWGSAPRPLGSLLAITDHGRIAGSVSGGCIEDDLLEQMRAGHLPTVRPSVTTYGVDALEAQRFGLPCGGTLRLVLEPLGESSGLDALLQAIERERLVSRHLDVETGVTRIVADGGQRAFSFDGRTLVTLHGARYTLLIIGAGELSRHLARFALALGYHVIVCDPREEYRLSWDVERVEFSTEMPDDLVLRLAPDQRTAIVALTHDPKLDDLALLEALKSDAFYVGAIGSARNRARRAERLASFDLSEAELSRLRSPVGLELGARTPAEIALSISAEMTALRHQVQAIRPKTAAA